MTRYYWRGLRLQFLRENFERRGSVWVARALGLKTKQVADKARRVGLRTEAKSPRGRPFASTDARRGVGRRFTKHAQPAGASDPRSAVATTAG